jgi:enoyl-CoA hydratase
MVEIDSEGVYVETDGHRADVVLDRPEKRNAMDLSVLEALREAFEAVDADDEVRAVVVRGEGPVFCGGLDLAMLTEFEGEEHREIHAGLRGVLDAIDGMTTPTVAAIHGAGIAGGFELTLPCDFRVLGAEATYGVTEVKNGSFPSGGSTQRLPRLVGLARAKEIVLMGDFVDPEDAAEMGLVTEVVDPDEVQARATELAEELATRAPLGIEQALTGFQHAFDVPLERGLDVESYLARDLYDTRDRAEGYQARREGREPEWEGR